MFMQKTEYSQHNICTYNVIDQLDRKVSALNNRGLNK